MAADMASTMADMAANVVFTPAYEQNVQALHDERALMVAGLLAAARVFWPKGRAWVEKKLRGMAGDDNEVDYAEILDTVEKESLTKTDEPESEAERLTVKTTLGFDQLQLTPQKQLPTTTTQPSTTTAQLPTTTAQSSLVSEELAVHLQKRLDKEIDQEYHDDMAKAKLLSLQQPKPPRAA